MNEDLVRLKALEKDLTRTNDELTNKADEIYAVMEVAMKVKDLQHKNRSLTEQLTVSKNKAFEYLQQILSETSRERDDDLVFCLQSLIDKLK